MMPVVERLAKSVARRLPRSVDVGDLIGAGHVGLMTALRRSAELDDSSFEAYAVTRIRGEILDELRRMDKLSRRQRDSVRRFERAERALAMEGSGSVPAAAIAERVGCSTAECQRVERLRAAGQQSSLQSGSTMELAVCHAGLSVDDDVDAKRRFRRVRRAAAALPDRLRHVVTLYEQGTTLKHIGKELGVTEARACQLRKQALDMLRVGANRSSLAPPSHAA
jgi:RNA polymerase sigma factor for flagellar operon FliA